MKQHLIDEHRHINVDYDWWDAVYDDFEGICKILGFKLDEGEPCFSGFASQGDGASFTGSYAPERAEKPVADMAPIKIREYAPKDEVLHKIADDLCMLGRLYYAPYVRITRHSSRYSHSNTMEFHVYPWDGEEEDWDQEIHDIVAEQFAEAARTLADWLYRALEREYDYLTSDEVVWEAIENAELDEEDDVMQEA